MESVEKGVGKEVRRLAANAVNMAVKAAAKGGAGARHMPMIPMPSQPKPAGEPQMAGAGAGWGARAARAAPAHLALASALCGFLKRGSQVFGVVACVVHSGRVGGYGGGSGHVPAAVLVFRCLES